MCMFVKHAWWRISENPVTKEEFKSVRVPSLSSSKLASQGGLWLSKTIRPAQLQ